ncbi:hypothetical protein [Lysobacter sp. F60174L2]|uniref:hypothetical protein n=1 Tax=Lysobacter sp. F60174L2 TaxID=3459295 RepID=UPI00403DAB2E
MRRTAFLACLCAAFAAPALASGGTIRFSGRIAEAPCAASAPSPGEVVLSRCPMAAQGARLRIEPLGRVAGAQLVDMSAGTRAGELPVTAAAVTDDRSSFSSRYRIQPDSDSPGTATYLVSIDYL